MLSPLYSAGEHSCDGRGAPMLISVPYHHAAVPEAQSSALLLTSHLSVIVIGSGATML